MKEAKLFNKKVYLMVGTIIIALAITTIAYAAHTTINTADGQVDPNWANVSILSNDGDDFSNNNFDINQAWIANAGDNSAFYFRVNLVGSGQLPTDYSSFEARLDCDRNGSFQNAADVIVYYAIDNAATPPEQLVECQGDDYPNCDFLGTNHSDTNSAAFGEEISGSPYNYEWRADLNNGDTNWSQCLETINVQFASLDGSIGEQDTTPWQTYSAPTAVKLAEFKGDSRHQATTGLLIGFAAVGLLFGGWLIRRSTLQPSRQKE